MTTGSGDSRTRTHTFDASEPISLSVRGARGDLTVRTTSEPQASVRLEAVRADVLERATVRMEGGELVIDIAGGQVSGVGDDLSGLASGGGSWSDRLSKGLRSLGGGFKGVTERIDISVSLPEHSSVKATLGAGDILIDGRLAVVSVGTGGGDLRCPAEVLQLRLSSGAGDITCREISETGRISTAAGDLRVETVSGRADLKSGAGDVTVGLLDGEAELKSGAGEVRVESARAGRLRARAGTGGVTVQVPEGTATRIEASTGMGQKTIDLQPTDGAGAAERTLELDLKSGIGDLRVTRAR